ncbi:MAG: polyphosphate kinase 1 [Anaerovoracaceae bacterium]
MKDREIFNSIYDNRELSWLRFNERVLEEADDKNIPLGERLSFLSIFQSNLDEFFMVRVGALTDRIESNPKGRDDKTGMTYRKQLDAVMEMVTMLQAKRDQIYRSCLDDLEEEGVEIVSYRNLSEDDAAALEFYFRNEMLPFLSPQIVGSKQPFPFLKARSTYIVAALTKKQSVKLGIVPCNSQIFPTLIRVPGDEKRLMLADELILHFVPEIFEHYTILGKSLIRIIRSADLDLDELGDESSGDYRKEMEKAIKSRTRLRPVKLEYSRLIGDAVIKKMCTNLGIDKTRAFYSEAPMDYRTVNAIRDYLKMKPGTERNFYRKLVPQKASMVDESRSMISQIIEKDILLSYPFESIDPFIRLLSEAAEDTSVISIKITLYRVAENSRIVECLARAAENGKDVTALVELRARFDEANNIECSRFLEEAGCRIIYGFDHFKVHSKLCQIVMRSEDGGAQYITQVGTGNYNENTASLYTDYCLMTASQVIAQDAAYVFNALSTGVIPDSVRSLMVAPKSLTSRVIEYIDREIEKASDGEPAYIGLKMNSVSDKTIIDKLIEASKAGVRIDMIIRGICCFKSGVQGETENISVTSIVGRLLEHSRVYIFGAEDDRDVYISSADFMTRNTSNRVEVAVPVMDVDCRKRITDMFEMMLRDNVKAWTQRTDGTYIKKTDSETPFNSQEYFFRMAYTNAGR